MSRDPIGFRGGWNLFAYSLNRPTTARDPSGLKINWLGTSRAEQLVKSSPLGLLLYAFLDNAEATCSKAVDINVTFTDNASFAANRASEMGSAVIASQISANPSRLGDLVFGYTETDIFESGRIGADIRILQGSFAALGAVGGPLIVGNPSQFVTQGAFFDLPTTASYYGLVAAGRQDAAEANAVIHELVHVIEKLPMIDSRELFPQGVALIDLYMRGYLR